MNIVCVICSELLTPSEDVYHTPCGHIFHFPCLIQWLERSKTCPQCREKTTEHKIHRIYFNFSNNDSIAEDATSLQSRVDNLNFQIKLKDKNLSNLTEANEKLEKQTAGLRNEIRKVESERNGKNSAIHALKEQVKFYKQQCSDTDNYRKENEHLKKNLEHLKNVQNIINTSVDEVDDLIMMTTDSSKLVTYISVLKRELSIMSRKSKEVREKYKSLHQDYMRVVLENKLLSEERIKRKELESRLINCESEKISLQTRLLSRDMLESARKCTCNEASVIALEKRDSSKVRYNTGEKSNGIINESINESVKVIDTSRLKKNDSCIIIDPNTAESTSQNIKSLNFFSTRDHGIKRQKSNSGLQVPSILMKKSKFDQPIKRTASGSGMSFDGFGGHAKYDKFPSPASSFHVKKIKDDLKTKKTKLDTGNKSLIDLLMYTDVMIHDS